MKKQSKQELEKAGQEFIEAWHYHADKKFYKTHAELIRTIFTGISTLVQTIALLHLFGLM